MMVLHTVKDPRGCIYGLILNWKPVTRLIIATALKLLLSKKLGSKSVFYEQKRQYPRKLSDSSIAKQTWSRILCELKNITRKTYLLS